jgi:hypothetical protein
MENTGTIENEEAPKPRDGKFVFEMIKNINVVFEKPVKEKKRKKKEKAPKASSFKRQSIFFTSQRVSLKVPSVYC